MLGSFSTNHLGARQYKLSDSNVRPDEEKMRIWLKVNFVSFINASVNLDDAKQEIDLFKLTINYLRRYCTGETGLRTENLVLRDKTGRRLFVSSCY